MPMNSSDPFQNQSRPDLALRRRGFSIPPRPMESDGTVPFDGVSSGQAQTALQQAWDKLYRARAILEAEQVHLRDDRIVHGEQAMGSTEKFLPITR